MTDGATSKRTWAGFVSLAVVIVYLYNGTYRSPFIFDDHNGILANQHIRSLGTAMSADPASSIAGRPVVSLSFAINYAIGGYNVLGYHVVNVLIHAINTFLLLSLTQRTLESCGVKDAKSQAHFVALIWAFHPLCTESVTYIFQRTESLMAMFLLLTLYCASRGWIVGAILACAMGMGCKEVMVVTPILVWVFDSIFLSGGFRKSLTKHRALYVGLAATWIVLFFVLRGVAMGIKVSSTGPAAISVWESLLTQAGVIANYLRLSFWPTPLVLDYYDWPVTRSMGEVWWQGCLILVLLAATIWALIKKPRIGFLGVWFFLILAPTSSVLPLANELSAERRMYLPLMAIVVLVVIAVWRIPIRIFVLTAIFIALMISTIVRNSAYGTEVSIWSDTVAKRPQNSRAWFNLGQAKARADDRAGAIEAYVKALDIEPNRHDTRYKLGVSLAANKQFDAAIEQFSLSIQLRPDLPEPYFERGRAFAAMGNYDAAIADFQKTIELRPDHQEAARLMDFAKKLRANAPPRP